ncbi:GNAT family N-acetyltransferase [Polycyclovorans algicola]|uniref:GNAT family N-acetyltransferase n=1 Tax=Polycyclovorans algicola TaxID=616992 RepID=UPI0004A6BC55|nr:GNAT family N-acetyltransferase [Polycyclovorans algicola]
MLIVPLAGSHDRQGFDCGRPELNDWLQRVARQHQGKGLSKTFVAVLDHQVALICAYYALTLTEVDTQSLSESRRKKLPRFIPGVRLGRLAVDRRYQGKRLGELLLMDALERVRQIHEHAGVVGLFVDAIDAQAARFYARYGFEAFVDEPLKLFLPVK